MAETLRSKDRKYAKNKQPIIVTERGDRFFMVEGERRWRSAEIAETRLIFALVFPAMTDIEVLVDSCLLNFCRENMNEYERAIAFRHLMEKRDWSQSELARQVGLHPVAISNAMKFFKVRSELLTLIKQGKHKPGIVKCFGSFRKAHQLKLYAICEREIFSKGKTINPRTFPRTLKKFAGLLGIRPTNRDKRNRTTAEMAIGGILTHMGGLKKELREIAGEGIEAIISARNLDPVRLVGEFSFIINLCAKEVERLKSHFLN